MLIGDRHLSQAVSKFIRNKHHYPELAIFSEMEYTFDAEMTIDLVAM